MVAFYSVWLSIFYNRLDARTLRSEGSGNNGEGGAESVLWATHFERVKKGSTRVCRLAVAGFRPSRFARYSIRQIHMGLSTCRDMSGLSGNSVTAIRSVAFGFFFGARGPKGKDQRVDSVRILNGSV